MRLMADMEPGDVTPEAVTTSETVPETVNSVTAPEGTARVWRKLAMAMVPLALIAVAYHHSSPFLASSHPREPWDATTKMDVAETVELTGSHSTWWDPNTQCTKMFRHVMQDGLGTVAVGEFDFSTQKLKMKHIKTPKQAAKALQDPYTNFVHVGKCGFQNRAVVWPYPDHTGDPSSAFLMANGECQRLATQFLDKDDSADCVAVYRVKSPRWGLAALDHFHGANTITHAVVGGHGSDSTKEDGVLVMSRMIYLSGVKSVDSMALVDTLHSKLTMHATVFLDSCYAGINGIAEMFSKKIPEHWIMGGTVSLQSYIKVHSTPFDGSAESGPTQVTSEIAEDRVIDPSLKIAMGRGYTQANYVQGMILQPEEGKMVQSKSYYKTGERMVAWLGGKNMGAVTQWLYPSGNGKVLKIGSKVKVLKSFEAFRMETSRTKALAVFPQSLPEGLSGTCVFLHSIGNAPTSGNALITFDLPKEYQDADKTGGAGQTLGALLVLTTDFQHLEIEV